jgi:hypothetical protein
LNLIIGLVVPMVDNLGHVGGLVAGVLLGATLGNRAVPDYEGSRGSRLLALIGSVLLCGAALAGVASQW